MKFEVRDFLVIALVGMVVVTIVSLFISQFSDLSTIKSGKAFLILFIAVFISAISWMSADKKLERSEIITLVFVALALAGAYLALHKFIPEIFSSIKPLGDLFSSIQI